MGPMAEVPEMPASVLSFRLCELPVVTRQRIVDSLNVEMVLPMNTNDTAGGTSSTAREVIYRDWRGLLTYAKLSPDQVSDIHSCTDKTTRILELWGSDGSVTVGKLFDALTCMARYDVMDDVRDDLDHHLLYQSEINYNYAIEAHEANVQGMVHPLVVNEGDCLSDDDRPNCLQHYIAFILYVSEDAQFVYQLKSFLESGNRKVLTRDNLRAGLPLYESVVRLLAERCDRIIVVYSPQFLQSSENAFFRDYVQRKDIQLGQNKMLPIIYKYCKLPDHVSDCTPLYYNSEYYDFWEKLAGTFEMDQPAEQTKQMRTATNNSNEIARDQQSSNKGKNFKKIFSRICLRLLLGRS